MAKYFLSNEFGDASATVQMHCIKHEDEEPFIWFEYSFSSMKVDCTNWEEFTRIVEYCDMWKEQIHYIATHVDGNWGIHLVNPDGDGKGILFECYDNGDGKCIDLGTLAECYGDCDDCDRYCYSFKNESPYENKCDCPQYHRCAEVYGTIYDEFGEEEDYDSLWDFRCYCTKINGREDLEISLKAKIPLF